MRAAILGIFLPVCLTAQSSVTLTPFAARNAALPEAPFTFGVSAARYSGIPGVRLGASAGRIATGAYAAWPATAWAADADLVLALGNSELLGRVLGGLAPAAFAGIGMQGIYQPEGVSVAVPDWSYGAILAQPLIAGVSLETEARRRSPIAAGGDLPEGFGPEWEYRLGLSLRFGGSPGHRGSRLSGTGARARRGAGPLRLPAPGAGVTARRVLVTADRHVGVPYKYGGTTPSGGFDCSGFVQFVFKEQGIALPRTSRQMAHAGDGLVPALGTLRAGDLMLFAQDGTRIDHVAIYAGNGRIIHSSSSGRGVRYDDLSQPRGQWFVRRWVAARRVIGTGTDFVSTLESALRIIEALDPPDRAPRP